jgi:hypothetical protein
MLLAALLAEGASCAHAQDRGDKVPFQIMETTIDDIHAAFKSGRLTARLLVRRYLDRIAAYDKQGPKIISIITLNDHALEEADRLDAAYGASGLTGPLHGIPILVKDEIDTAGAHRRWERSVQGLPAAARDAFAIRLRQAGHHLWAETTLSEYAASDTYGSMFGVTRNPYDLERTVAARRAARPRSRRISQRSRSVRKAASIRRPAGWNWRRQSAPDTGAREPGMWDGASPTAQMGPMARTVKDLEPVGRHGGLRPGGSGDGAPGLECWTGLCDSSTETASRGADRHPARSIGVQSEPESRTSGRSMRCSKGTWRS